MKFDKGLWPGYPYTMPLPVDYSKVGLPGITISNKGKINCAGDKATEIMNELEKFAEMMKKAKFEEQVKRYDWERVSHEDYERNYKAWATGQIMPGEDVLRNTSKLMRPKK